MGLGNDEIQFYCEIGSPIANFQAPGKLIPRDEWSHLVLSYDQGKGNSLENKPILFQNELNFRIDGFLHQWRILLLSFHHTQWLDRLGNHSFWNEWGQ